MLYLKYNPIRKVWQGIHVTFMNVLGFAWLSNCLKCNTQFMTLLLTVKMLRWCNTREELLLLQLKTFQIINVSESIIRNIWLTWLPKGNQWPTKHFVQLMIPATLSKFKFPIVFHSLTNILSLVKNVAIQKLATSLWQVSPFGILTRSRSLPG